MNSLVNYGSDDDYDDSSEEKQTDWRGTSSKDKQPPSHRENDANYEEVQMDLSEESDSEAKEAARRSRDRESRDRKERHERDEHRSRRSDKDGKSRNDKEDRYSSHRRDRDRKPRRSPSRERRRSRSPKRSDRESKHSRSRSKSRDRSARKYSKKYDRDGSRSRQVDRNETQKSEGEEKRNNNSNENDRFFMPGITGRFRDQIERRKQLWQKKDTDQKDNKEGGQNKKVWETTTFAQDTDGKVANKFKRLMGIRNTTESAGSATDVLKKQEEMFSSMEQQYEVARTATHTMRGVGLGFGSYQR